MTRTPASRRRRRDHRPRIEALEGRTLLSTADPTALPTPALSTSIPSAAPTNASFDKLIGASAVRSQYGVDGSGLAAAVIDTGVDYNHPALGGAFGPGQKVEGGVDLAMRDADPLAETWSHGTMVAGLIASSAPQASGVAPGADLVPLRVFGNNNQGSFDLIGDALQYVIDHHAEMNISVVNISLTDGGNYSTDPFLFSEIDGRLRSEISTLRGLNIPVVTASGNSFDGQTQGMGFLAILDGTISVTATDQQDRLVGNAQRLGTAAGGKAATDLAAPGSGLVAPSENGGYAKVEGTSFAAPMVSGAILLLQNIYSARFGKLPAVADVERWLTQGSNPIRDPATGLTIGRLDIAKAASLIPPAPQATPTPTRSNPNTQAPTPTQTPTPVTPSTPTPGKSSNSNNPTPPRATPSTPAPPRTTPAPTTPPAAPPAAPKSEAPTPKNDPPPSDPPALPSTPATPPATPAPTPETNQNSTAMPPVGPKAPSTTPTTPPTTLASTGSFRVWQLALATLRGMTERAFRLAAIRRIEPSPRPAGTVAVESPSHVAATAKREMAEGLRERHRLWVLARRAARG